MQAPKEGTRWRHADGGRYLILPSKGVVKFDGSPWESVVVYDHDDGTISQGPYHTNLTRFLARFTPETLNAD